MELATVCANDGARLMKGFLYYSSNTRLFRRGRVFLPRRRFLYERESRGSGLMVAVFTIRLGGTIRER